MLDEYKEHAVAVASKFRVAGATSPDMALTPEDVGLHTKENVSERAGLMYLVSTRCVKLSKTDKNRLYLDEEAYENPEKSSSAYTRKIMLWTAAIIIFGLVVAMAVNLLK